MLFMRKVTGDVFHNVNVKQAETMKGASERNNLKPSWLLWNRRLRVASEAFIGLNTVWRWDRKGSVGTAPDRSFDQPRTAHTFVCMNIEHVTHDMSHRAIYLKLIWTLYYEYWTTDKNVLFVNTYVIYCGLLLENAHRH